MILIFPLSLFAQDGLVIDGVDFTVEAGTSVLVEDADLINQNGGQVYNSGTIYLDQDWTQTGLSNYTGTGWMWFQGVLNQNLSSIANLTVPRLRVDNGQRLILGSDITVSTELDLTANGNIELGTNNLLISSGGLILNYDDNNFVITNGTGYLQQEVGVTNVVFPVGRSSYNPATLNNSGTTDNFQIRVEDIVYDNGTTGVPETQDIVNRTWLIDETVSGGSNVNLTLQWAVPDELTTFDRIQSGIAHWDGISWDHPGTYTTAIANGTYWTQNRTGLTSFSPFAVEDHLELLPVDLLSFEAIRIDPNQVELDWVTAAETNNKGFHLERMLENETSFSPINWVDGFGTTTITQYYQYTDENSFSGTSYYRLKQENKNGSFKYSGVRAVEGIQSTTVVKVFPNPTNNNINISFGDVSSKQVNIRMYGADGKLIYHSERVIEPNKLITIEQVQDLPAGAYLLQLLLDDGSQVMKKVIKSSF
jgi:hypothetical protein